MAMAELLTRRVGFGSCGAMQAEGIGPCSRAVGAGLRTGTHGGPKGDRTVTALACVPQAAVQYIRPHARAAFAAA